MALVELKKYYLKNFYKYIKLDFNSLVINNKTSNF